MKKTFVRIAAFLFAFVMLFGITACGKNNKDTSDPKDIEMVIEGWMNQSVPSDYLTNPYKKYIDEKFDINFSMKNVSSVSDELTKRYASSSARKPDIVVFGSEDGELFEQLLNQGFYIEDYTPFMDQLPTYKKVLEENESARIRLVRNGKIIGLTQPADVDTWQFKIRKDWVEQYNNGKMPSTPDELLEMARNVKKANPNLYMFTSAGGQEGDLGNIDNLQNMYSPQDFYVDNNEVKNPIITGDRQKFLDFMRTVVSEGLIDPDWSTQKWEVHKNKLYGNRIGVDYYSADIICEAPSYSNGKHEAADVWINLPMPKDPDSPLGGKDAPSTMINKYIAISKRVATNTEKMANICKLLEGWLYPNEAYYALRWGMGIDGFDEGDEYEKIIVDGQDTGYIAFYALKNQREHALHINTGLKDYGAFCSTKSDKVVEYGSTITSYSTSGPKYVEIQQETIAYKIENANFNYMELLSFDSRTLKILTDLQSEYEIRYINGREEYSYEEFQRKWLNSGGQALLDSAKEQFIAAGLISK